MKGLCAGLSRAGAAAAICLGLTGCLDLTESVTVRGDGTASVSYEIGLDQMLYTLARLGGGVSGEDPVHKLCGMATATPAHRFSENIANREARIVNRDRDVVCALDIELKDIRNFSANDLRMAPPDIQDMITGSDIARDMQPEFTITMTEVKDGVLQLEQSIGKPATMREPEPEPETDTNGTMNGQDPEAFARTMLATAFSGRNLTLRLTAAEIIETNGTVSEDGRTATWQTPIAELVNPDGTFEHRFSVTFRYKPTMWERVKGVFGGS